MLPAFLSVSCALTGTPRSLRLTSWASNLMSLSDKMERFSRFPPHQKKTCSVTMKQRETQRYVQVSASPDPPAPARQKETLIPLTRQRS